MKPFLVALFVTVLNTDILCVIGEAKNIVDESVQHDDQDPTHLETEDHSSKERHTQVVKQKKPILRNLKGSGKALLETLINNILSNNKQMEYYVVDNVLRDYDHGVNDNSYEKEIMQKYDDSYEDHDDYDDKTRSNDIALHRLGVIRVAFKPPKGLKRSESEKLGSLHARYIPEKKNKDQHLLERNIPKTSNIFLKKQSLPVGVTSDSKRTRRSQTQAGYTHNTDTCQIYNNNLLELWSKLSKYLGKERDKPPNTRALHNIVLMIKAYLEHQKPTIVDNNPPVIENLQLKLDKTDVVTQVISKLKTLMTTYRNREPLHVGRVIDVLLKYLHPFIIHPGNDSCRESNVEDLLKVINIAYQKYLQSAKCRGDDYSLRYSNDIFTEQNKLLGNLLENKNEKLIEMLQDIISENNVNTIDSSLQKNKFNEYLKDTSLLNPIEILQTISTQFPPKKKTSMLRDKPITYDTMQIQDSKMEPTISKFEYTPHFANNQNTGSDNQLGLYNLLSFLLSPQENVDSSSNQMYQEIQKLFEKQKPLSKIVVDNILRYCEMFAYNDFLETIKAITLRYIQSSECMHDETMRSISSKGDVLVKDFNDTKEEFEILYNQNNGIKPNLNNTSVISEHFLQPNENYNEVLDNSISQFYKISKEKTLSSEKEMKYDVNSKLHLTNYSNSFSNRKNILNNSPNIYVAPDSTSNNNKNILSPKSLRTRNNLLMKLLKEISKNKTYRNKLRKIENLITFVNTLKFKNDIRQPKFVSEIILRNLIHPRIGNPSDNYKKIYSPKNPSVIHLDKPEEELSSKTYTEYPFNNKINKAFVEPIYVLHHPRFIVNNPQFIIKNNNLPKPKNVNTNDKPEKNTTELQHNISTEYVQIPNVENLESPSNIIFQFFKTFKENETKNSSYDTKSIIDNSSVSSSKRRNMEYENNPHVRALKNIETLTNIDEYLIDNSEIKSYEGNKRLSDFL